MTYEELVSKTNAAISELVYDKVTLRNAYNYYNCERDKEQFKFLEDNYGIGSPTQVEFIPLIKKHIDALIGEYLDMPIKAEISCKDEKTINNIYRDKQLKIANECYNLLQQNLKNNLLRFLDNKNLQDLNIKEQLDKLKEDVEENFISEYEIAAHNIIKFIKQSRNIDLTTKLKQLYLDLLVTGFTFYRVFPANKNIQIECLNPLDVFPELNYNSPYINECKRIVVRKYLSRQEILNKYGKKLSKEDLEKIKDNFKEYSKYSESYIVRSYTNSVGHPITNGIRAGEEVDPINGHWYNLELIPVYEVEWIETDKNFVEQLYGSVRIGDEIYIVDNKSKDVVRTMDAPEKCYLTVNGVWFNNRGSKPYSMAINCMVLQD